MDTDPTLNPRTGRRAVATGAAIVIATAAVYLSSLTHGFIGMDDDVYVTANPLIRSLAPANLWAILTRPYAEFYHPVTLLSLAADYAVWEINPFGYHLTDSLLHLLNTALVFWVCHELVLAAVASRTPAAEPESISDQPATNNRPPATIAARTAALIAAALFGLHPLHVESVAWAAQRKDLLCSLFYLLALAFYLRHAATARTRPDREEEIQNPKSKIQNRTWLRLSLAAFLASLLSKSMGVTLPVVLVLIDYCPLRRLGGLPGRAMAAEARNAWLEKLPFLGLALAATVATLAAQQQGGALRSAAEIPWSLRPWIVVHSYAFYLWRSIVPADLTVLYPLPHVGAHNILSWVSLAALLAITAVALVLWRRLPVLLACWLFYGITLAPVCGLLSFGAQSFADRYSYLPLLGPFLLIAVAVVRASQMGRRGLRRATSLMIGAMVGIALFLLAAQTARQIATWHNGESVWLHHLRIHPDHARAVFNLAYSYQSQGRIDRAMRAYERCLELATDDFNANINYGSLLLRQGEATRAAEHFRRAAAEAPESGAPRTKAGAHYNLGLALVRLEKDDEAVVAFKQAVAADPRYAAAHAQLGDAYAQRGRVDLAIDHYFKALAIDPRMAQAHENLGLAWLAAQQPDKARVEFERTVHLRPRSPAALVELAILDVAAGRTQVALERLAEAARYSPRDPQIHVERAKVLRDVGQRAPAIAALKDALAIDPQHVEARAILGDLLE